MEVLDSTKAEHIPTEEDIDRIKPLLDANLIHQAWSHAKQWAPFEQWQGPRASRLASSMASRLGASRRSNRMDILNYRQYRDDHLCFLFGQFARISRLGDLKVLPDIEERLLDQSVEGTDRADLLALQGGIYSDWSDFATAFPLLDQALELNPNDSWTNVQKSRALVSADRYQEAEELARRALEMRQGYSPAVIQLVQCLTHLGRDKEAIEVLEQAHDMTENGVFAGRLQAFFSEREDHVKALEWLDEYVRLMPLMEKEGKKWVASRRCDFVYMAGDFPKYLELAKDAGKYHEHVAKRLNEPEMQDRRRKRLDVPFIRQHSMTCAPATLAAISSYFGKEHDHLEIAEAICYDGTPWHKERQWAEGHGFVVREFRVTREIVIDLIDCDIPFTLTTSWATGAHLQACIGYDDRQGVILLRDPTHRHFGEMLIENLIKDHPIEGPRGMVMVPDDKSHLLDNLEFPDSAIYDARNELMAAIDDHDRVKIMAAFAKIRVCDESHPMLLSARLSMAWYDNDASEERKVMDETLERFPKHSRTQLRHLYAVQKTEGFQAQRDLLESIIGSGKCDSVFYSEMGNLMLGDVTMADMALYYLNKAVRYSRSDSRAFASLARVLVQKGDLEEALRCRRIAACLNDKFEPYSRAYFDLCVEMGHIEDGLEFLRNRIKELGSKDSGPWITLVNCLESLSRDSEARSVLKDAMKKLPSDGGLMLAAVEKFVSWGKLKKAYQILEESRALVSENSWCREMARAADVEGLRSKALRYWKRVIELEEDSISAQRNYTRLLVDESGLEDAVVHLEKVVKKYPQREDLLTLYADWLSEIDLSRAIEIMERAVSLAPNDTWNLRELAVYRSRAGDMDGAIASVQLAIEKNPRIAESHGVLGGFYFQLSQFKNAADCFERSVQLDIDYTYAIERWVECGVRLGNASEVLEAILAEMRHQVTTGPAIITYRESAYKHIEPDVLLAQLIEISEIRPDLWEAWFALKDQQVAMALNDDALTTAKVMVERFQLIPRAWAELADVYRVRGEPDQEIKALKKALKIAPSWDFLARKMSSFYETQGRLEEAEAIQRQAIEWNPRNAANYGVLADMLWKQGRREEAMEVLCDGLRKDYYYGWGWNNVGIWGEVLDNEKPILELLDFYRERFGHKSNWWEKESGVHYDLGNPDKALEAVERGLECNPEACDLHVAKAFYLSKLGKLEEAMDATNPAVYNGNVPRELLARRAWLLKNYGHSKEAKALLVQLSEDHPDYVWPKRQLMHYLNAENDWQEVAKLSRELIRLEPETSLFYGWLGEAQEKLMDQQGAMESYTKALIAEPDYPYAAYRLGVISLSTGNVDKLREMMPALEYYQPGGLVETFKSRLCCVENDQQGAIESLRTALSQADLDTADIEGLRASFEKSGWMRLYQKTRDEEVDAGRIASGAVLSDWIVGKRFPMRLAKRISAMDYPIELKEKAWEFIMNWLVQDGLDDDAAKIVRKYPELKRNVYLWGQACWMLTTLGKYAEVIHWMNPLKKRDGVEDWMLYNLTIAVSSLRGADAARYAAQFALENVEPGKWMVAHAMSEALMAAKDGNDDLSKHYLNQYGEEVDGWSKGLKYLAEMVLHASDRAQVSQLWTKFKIDFPKWRTDAHHYAYVAAAKQAFKLRKEKWPGPRFARKPTVKKSTPGWVWIVVFLLFGWKLIALVLAGIISLFVD